MLFMIGVKVAMRDGLDFRTSLIVGVSFWIGVAFQYDMVFPEQVSDLAGGLLDNGMTAGGIAAILLTLFVEFTGPRPSRFEAELAASSLPRLRTFLSEFATRGGWDEAMAQRLDAVGEETVLTLMREDESGDNGTGLRLRVTARREGRLARLEFLVSAGDENLEDRIALLDERNDDAPAERDVSLRLLRHFATSVRHQQYRNTDIVTLLVEPTAPATRRSA